VISRNVPVLAGLAEEWRVRLRRLGGRGSVRGSPCGEPARLCPPFFLQRGYPRERISSESGALYLTAPPLLRRLRRTAVWIRYRIYEMGHVGGY
jgi:hypothetical protein